MEFTKVYTLKKEVDEQQFLRNVLIGLSKDEKSPANIMNAKFGKVTEFNSEFLVLSADVDVYYSGSCGYDRQEEYITQAFRSVREGDYYKYRGVTKRATSDTMVYMDVVETKIVTEWRPHSGTLSSNKTMCGLNEDNRDRELEKLYPSAWQEVKDESVLEEGTASVNFSAYESVLEDCKSMASREVHWPGNHHKDTIYSYKTTEKLLECYIVPCYMVEFEYNGKKYRARGLAIGKANEVHDVPEADAKVESIADIEKRRVENVIKAEKPLKFRKLFKTFAVIMGLVGWFGLIFTFLNLLNGVDIPGGRLFLILGFATMAVFIIIQIVINIKVKKAVKEINIKANNEKKNLNNIKVDFLVVALKKLNLPGLSTIEKNGISSSDDYK